jgi:hypothetical protein
VTSDRCGGTEVRDVDTVMSRLTFPMATIGYYIMRDALDTTSLQAGFTDYLTHVN